MQKDVKIVVRDEKADMGLNAAETEKLDTNLLLSRDDDAQEIFKGEQPLDMEESL